MANAEPFVEGRLNRSKIVVFSKVYSPEGRICEDILKEHDRLLPSEIFEWVNIEKRSDCPQVEDYLWLLSGKNNREVPLLFVKHRCVGGYDDIIQMHNDGRLGRLLKNLTLDDDEGEDEDVEGEEIQPCQVTVRIEAVDDTELLIRVGDSFNEKDYNADYNVRLDKKFQKEVQEMFKQELEERGQQVGELVSEQDLTPKIPVWLPVESTFSKLNIAMVLSRETTRFIMIRPVVIEVKNEDSFVSEVSEDNAVSDPSKVAKSDTGSE